MSVIDAALRFPQCRWVLTHEEIREELIRQLADGSVAGKDVAAILNIAPARVTELRKRTRRVQPHEMVPLAQYLEMQTAPPEQATVLMLPVQLPSVDRLTQMMRYLLQAVGQREIADELAPRLARRLPGALVEALTREPLDPSEDEEIFPGENPPPPAKSRRGRGQPLRTR